MKKIILIKVNCTQDHSEHILPLGILSVGSALKKAGYEVELINITEKEIAQTADMAVAQNPLYVGLTVMTGAQTKHSVQMSKAIKAKNKNLPIVWGGIHPSLMPVQCLNEDYIDFVVISEGELSAVELSDKIAAGQEPSQVAGVGYKSHGQAKINPHRSFIGNLDDYHLDYSLIDVNKFVFPLGRYKRAFVYKASRGCPFNCAFCYNLAFNKNQWRVWSVQTVTNDINWLKKNYQIDAVKFYDDNFFVDKKRALEILEKIDIPTHLEIRIDSFDDELAEKLKKYKVFDLLIGVESGSNRILKMIDKNFTVEKTMATVKMIAHYGLPATYSAIVGLPTETKEEFEATIDLLYQISEIHPQAAFTLGAYLPYPGSKMYDLAMKSGFEPPEKTEDWGKIDRFRKDFTSPWVDAKKVWRIREYFKFLNWKLGPVIKWFKWRIKHRFFACPIDIYLVEFLSGLALEEKGVMGKLMRRIYNLIKNKNEKVAN